MRLRRARRHKPESAAASPAQVRLSFAPVVKTAAPAVVNVYVSHVEKMPRNPLFDDPIFQRFFGRGGGEDERVQKALGSGVIIDPSGLVVTNFHVVENATEVKVALADRREFEAEIALRDPRTDLAVLRLKGGDRFPTLEMGNSDALEVGDFVIAVGDPFGVGQTVTQGIVSALARTQIGASDYGFYSDRRCDQSRQFGRRADRPRRPARRHQLDDLFALRRQHRSASPFRSTWSGASSLRRRNHPSSGDAMFGLVPISAAAGCLHSIPATLAFSTAPAWRI